MCTINLMEDLSCSHIMQLIEDLKSKESAPTNVARTLNEVLRFSTGTPETTPKSIRSEANEKMRAAIAKAKEITRNDKKIGSGLKETEKTFKKIPTGVKKPELPGKTLIKNTDASEPDRYRLKLIRQ
jgi:hypothetical protein